MIVSNVSYEAEYRSRIKAQFRTLQDVMLLLPVINVLFYPDIIISFQKSNELI